MRSRPSLGSAIALFMAVLGGCRAHAGGDAPAGTAAPESESFGEIDAFQHDLEVSEQRLFAELDRKRDGARFAEPPPAGESAPLGEGAAEKSGGSPPAPAPPPRPAEPAASAPPPADADAAPAAPRSTIGSPCDQACRALGSMKRSADGICSIAGESDERCSTARTRVANGAARVRQAGCACSQAP